MKNHLLIVLAVFLAYPTFAQNVGIGTATPIYKLQIEGDAYVNGGWLRVDGNKGLYFEDYGGGWYMSDATWIRSYGNKNIYHNTGIMRTDGTFRVGSGGSTFYAVNGGNMAYRTNVLFANTAGNVGIGTSSPSQKLEITGGSYPMLLFSGNYSGRSLYVGGGSQSSLGTSEATIGVTNGNLHLDSETSSHMYFQHYAQGNSIFNANGGNVGIGTTSPGYKLDVSGNGRFTGQVTVPLLPTADPHAASKKYVDDRFAAVTEVDPTWSGPANTTDPVSRSGNITVGDITVDGDDINTTGSMRLNSSGGYIDFRSNHIDHGLILRDFDGSSTSWGGIRVVDSDRMEFRMDGGSYGGSLVIKDNNYVGIGVTSPVEKLDVSGDIKASGEVYWGNGETRTQTRNDAGASGAGVRSGFYETSAPVNFPSGASSWWHMIDTRHSNTSNNYAMQIAGSFFDQNLWYRKTDNSATTAWSKIMSSSDINGTTNYVSKFTSANSLGNSRIYDNGTNVGIGTTGPTETLDINGDLGLSGKLALRGNDSYLRLNQDGDFTGGVYTPGHIRADGNFSIINSSPTFYFRDSDNPSYMIHANSDRLYILHGATNSTSWNGNRPLTIYQGNKVGINNSTPSYQLHVSGRIRSNGINETSDIRFKKDIQDLEGSLEKIEQLRGVSYYWRQDEFPEQKFNDGLDLGLIAQEVEQILPEVVHTDNEGYKSVQYSHIVPVLVEAVKELSSELKLKDAILLDVQNTQINQACELERLESKYKAQINNLSQKVETYESLLKDIEQLDMEALKAAFSKNQYSASK